MADKVKKRHGGFLPAPRPVFRFASQCRDKVRFKNKADAQAVAERFGQRVYRCVHCGGRHLTSVQEPR